MNKKPILRILIVFSIVIIDTGCDQATKIIVRNHISQNEIIRVLSNHLIVTRVENSGAFLSLGNSLPRAVKNIVLNVLPALAILWALFYALTKQTIRRAVLWGLCFIIGGGIGNIFDRIAYGSVTDFLHIGFGRFQTGIFNIADMSIMTGIFIIVLNSFLKKKTAGQAEA
ncbi:MAG: lspA [Chitinophagaceae bacterium]|nr:lspA [Chitinophagaceae bacterium]